MTLRLHAFGSLYLTRDDAVLTGPAGQRRLLAILAVLASVGERGISRDKLLALLWSDGEPDRARHALTQSLYHIKKALGSERIFLSGSDLRLNAEVLSSDVGDFRLACDDGRFADAVALYGGAFLDGFFLNGEAEFEFWLTAERDRLARQYRQALAALAQSASEQDDRNAELRWRSRLVDDDPLCGPAVAELMRCLLAAGDPSAALMHARAYESRLWAELELPPDRAVVDLVTEIRRTAPRGHPVLPSGEPPFIALDVKTDRGAIVPRAHEVRRPRWRAIGAAAALIVVAGGARAASHIAEAREAVRRETIAVSPFRIRSSSASAAYVRDALLDLLPTRIGEADRKRSADPAHVLDVWHQLAPAPESLSSRGAAVRVGRALGAGEIVVGSIEDDPGGLRVRASVIDAATERVRASASAVGGTDSVVALADRLITALLLPEADTHIAASDIRAAPPRALRAYLTGLSASRRGDYDGAMRAFASALDEDPGFALAALHLAISADRVNAAEQHDRGVAIAWARQVELPPGDRAYLRAFAGPRYPEPSSAGEVLDAWESAVRLAPDRPDGWFQLGESFYYDGDLLGMHDALGRAEFAFRRALSFDPTFAPARRMLALLLARRGDTTALRRMAVRGDVVDPTDALGVFVRWRVAKALNDARGLDRVRGQFDDAPSGALRAIAMTSQFDGVSMMDGDRAIEILRRRRLSESEQIDLALARHSRALNSGDYAAALAITGELGAIEPSMHPHLRLRVLDGLYSKGDRQAAQIAAEALEHLIDERRPRTAPDTGVWMADRCVLAQWRLAAGDTLAVRRLIAPLRAGAVPRFPVPVGANPLTCGELMETSLALAAHGRGAADRLAHMDSLMLSGPAVGDAMRYANLAIAREYQRLGEPRLGLAALQRRSFMRGWPRYRATGLQLQIALATAAGDSAAARSARQRLDAAR